MFLSNWSRNVLETMHTKEQDNFLSGIQHALGLPICSRCAELTVLLDRGSILELDVFFPILIDNIFGPQGTISWGLRATTEMQCEEFRQLQHFLSPRGPLFKLIYTLLEDPNIRYEFPISYLPIKIRNFLENSQSHPFYSELVHMDPQSRQVTSLLLNAFDYFMFHFAYHLINPWQQRSVRMATSWNTVYYVLCCDYIMHFLPATRNSTVLPVIYYNGKNPLESMKCYLLEQPTRSSGLINSKTLSKFTDESFQKNLDIHHPRNDIWRSETVLTVFTDMWFHNNQVHEPLNTSFNMPTSTRFLHYDELPTGEYMRIVRSLIKQLHSFSASAKADDTHLAELKKIAIPMIQGKFYIFLRNLIHRWPLDGSFRLVLELWLTYIQPWRYPPNHLENKMNKQALPADVDYNPGSSQNLVDREGLPFVAENLLCYTVIFQQLLPRFGRVDLVSPKMSLMLYRITKVFDQPNLVHFLREVEDSVENGGSPTRKYTVDHWKNKLPPLSPTTNWSRNRDSTDSPFARATGNQEMPRISENTSLSHEHLLHTDKKWSAIVRQMIFELEGPNFCYKPLFIGSPAVEVSELIGQIKRSTEQAEELVKRKEEEENKMYSGVWGHIKYFLDAPLSNDEFTLRDRQRVPLYLQESLQNLLHMFNIEVTSMDPEVSSSNTTASFDVSNDFDFLNPKNVITRIKSIRYEGDPDELPIRTTENAFLVRSLYHLSLSINEMYGATFYRWYHSPTYAGRLAKQFLCPPITIYKYDKITAGSPRVSRNLRPRVSLRFLANYTLIGYLIVGAILALMVGHRIETFFAFILLLVILYKAVRAVRYTQIPVRHIYPTEGFGNISFNDSF